MAELDFELRVRGCRGEDQQGKSRQCGEEWAESMPAAIGRGVVDDGHAWPPGESSVLKLLLSSFRASRMQVLLQGCDAGTARRRAAITLRRARQLRRRRFREIVHCRLSSALAMRDCGKSEPHLHAGERAAEHEIVEVAQMTDAKNLAGHLAQALAQRHVD